MDDCVYVCGNDDDDDTMFLYHPSPINVRYTSRHQHYNSLYVFGVYVLHEWLRVRADFKLL